MSGCCVFMSGSPPALDVQTGPGEVSGCPNSEMRRRLKAGAFQQHRSCTQSSCQIFTSHGHYGPLQLNGMCFAELTVQEKLKPNASTLQTVDLPHVTNCGPGPVSEPGAFAIRGYSPGLLVGPVRASAQALTFPAIATPHRDWFGVISKVILARSTPTTVRPPVNNALTIAGKPPARPPNMAGNASAWASSARSSMKIPASPLT